MPQPLAAPKRMLRPGSPQGNRLSMGAVSPLWRFEPGNEGSFLTMRCLRVGPPAGRITGDSVGGLRSCFARASR